MEDNSVEYRGDCEDNGVGLVDTSNKFETWDDCFDGVPPMLVGSS